MTRLTVALFAIGFLFGFAQSVIAETPAQCTDRVDDEFENCEISADNDRTQCANDCVAADPTNTKSFNDCYDNDCASDYTSFISSCNTTRTSDTAECDELNDLTDENGICRYGINAVYAGCLRSDGTSANPSAVRCQGIVDASGNCIAAVTTGSGSSSSASLGNQYDSIRSQGIIFGNICQSRSVDCPCRDRGQCTLNDVLQVVVNISVFILGISGSIVLIMLVYGGFLWLASHGNAGMVEEGRKTIVGAVIGLIIVFGAYTMITFLVSVLTTGESPTATDSSGSPTLEEVLDPITEADINKILDTK